VPLSKIQIEILRLLASQRDPESYVAGATALNRDASRYSGDIDVFHDREDRVASAAINDAKTLEAGGFGIKWLRQLPLTYTAEVTRQDAGTRLEWVVDSDFRFFPTMPDEMFGYVLHPVDLAMNKVMAAAGRREVRDLVDLVTVHETILPLGAVILAAVEKSPGFTPEGLIAEIRRNSTYPAAEWRALVSTEPLDPHVVTMRLRAALDDAEAFVMRMPTEKLGLLFLQGGKVVQPDPTRLESYQTHAGQRRGHWPTSSEIIAAMFERYRKKPGL
jgi:Nucleotidyl transferase AbiEii toxin, Type IV TA system